jgi:hypothetical protein
MHQGPTTPSEAGMMVDKAVALAAEFVKEGSPWLLRRKIRKNIRADSRSYSDALLDRISLLDYPEKKEPITALPRVSRIFGPERRVSK